MGIMNLEMQNRCLLSKWLFKLCNEEGIWHDLIKNKYLKNKTLSQVEKKAGVSYFWASLMGVKDQFLNLGRFRLNNETQIRFWEDKWLGHRAFKTRYTNLCNVVCKK